MKSPLSISLIYRGLLFLALLSRLPFLQAQDSVISVCLLTDFQPAGAYTLWLDGLPASLSAAYPLFSGGQLTIYDDSSANITGRVVNEADPNRKWDMDIWLIHPRTYTQWTALGRGVKIDQAPAAVVTANQQNWKFWEVDSTRSRLYGVPGTLYAGDTLTLKHNPANYFYGFQMGVGANAKNAANGISGWFKFSGDYAGHGDVNANTYCNGATPLVCTLAVDSSYTTCQNNGTFTMSIKITGSGNAFQIADTFGNVILSGLSAGIHTFGAYPSGTLAPVFVSDQANPACPDTFICLIDTCAVIPPPPACNLLVDTVYTVCLNNTHFGVVLTFTGTGNSYQIKDNFGTTLSNLSAGTYTFGNYSNGAIVSVIVKDLSQSACSDTLHNLTRTCAPQVCNIAIDTLYTLCTTPTGFNVIVGITGTGGPFVIQDDQGGLPFYAPTTGVYDIGFYLNSIDVTVTVSNPSIAGCAVSNGPVTADCTPVPLCNADADTLFAVCTSDSTFDVVLSFTGSGNQFTVKDAQNLHVLTNLIPGTYVLGPYVTGSNVTVQMINPNIFGCIRTAGTVTADCAPAIAPENATCATATTVMCNTIIQATTKGASAQNAPATCGVLHNGPGVWFSYMGTGDKITLNTCASVLPVNTRISVYKGDCAKMFCTAGNDDAPYCTGGQSEVGFKTTAGTPYLIYVSTAGAAGADFTLKVSCTGASQAGQLYPNPSSEEVFVDVEAGEETVLRWTLYNTQGQIVSGDEAPLTEGTNPVRVDVSELGEGIYTLQLRTESGELGFRRLQVKR